MFHKAVDLQFSDGTKLQVSFQDGIVKEYDIATLFGKYPALRALEERELFVSGRLVGSYGIVWNDDLDIETETIYESGETIGHFRPAIQTDVGAALARARAQCSISQKELAASSGIDQSDISKIENGFSNPTVGTLKRLASAMNMEVEIVFR